jgi:hypothetical protein
LKNALPPFLVVWGLRVLSLVRWFQVLCLKRRLGVSFSELSGGRPGCPQTPKSPEKNAVIFGSFGALFNARKTKPPDTANTVVHQVYCLIVTKTLPDSAYLSFPVSAVFMVDGAALIHPMLSSFSVQQSRELETELQYLPGFSCSRGRSAAVWFPVGKIQDKA